MKEIVRYILETVVCSGILYSITKKVLPILNFEKISWLNIKLLEIY